MPAAEVAAGQRDGAERLAARGLATLARHHQQLAVGDLGRAVVLLSLLDFGNYVMTQSAEVVASGFVDAEAMSCTVIFNLGDTKSPRHGDFTATLNLRKTAAFRALERATSIQFAQKELSDWIEDWASNLQALAADDSPIGVWADAFGDGILKAYPLDRISNVASDVDLEHADPFSRTEIELIGKADPSRRADARMIEFNCWTGLSLSELIGLAAEDVDLQAGLVHVRRALVVGEFKVPKERSRVRVVELIDPALELMREIVAAAKEAQAEEITVIQRDNITSKKMKVTFLFRSSTSGLLWSGKTLSNWFTAHLKKAEVRHRGANQCRHTFASQMLSSYVPVEWVARQLGHADTTMVRKHYDRWIPKDTKSMVGLVSKMLGFRQD